MNAHSDSIVHDLELHVGVRDQEGRRALECRGFEAQDDYYLSG